MHSPTLRTTEDRNSQPKDNFASGSEVISLASGLISLVVLTLELLITLPPLFRVRHRKGATLPLEAAAESETDHRVLKVCAYGAGGTLVVLLLANFFLFTPVTRWLIGKAAAKQGIELTIGEVKGNLFTGYLQAEELSIIRPREERRGFDIRIESVTLRTGIWGLIKGERMIDKLSVRGVKGTISQRREIPASVRTVTPTALNSDKVQIETDSKIDRILGSIGNQLIFGRKVIFRGLDGL